MAYKKLNIGSYIFMAIERKNAIAVYDHSGKAVMRDGKALTFSDFHEIKDILKFLFPSISKYVYKNYRRAIVNKFADIFDANMLNFL